MVPCKRTAEEVSFEWSHHRISSTKGRTTLHYLSPLYWLWERKGLNSTITYSEFQATPSSFCFSVMEEARSKIRLFVGKKKWRKYNWKKTNSLKAIRLTNGREGWRRMPFFNNGKFRINNERLLCPQKFYSLELRYVFIRNRSLNLNFAKCNCEETNLFVS